MATLKVVFKAIDEISSKFNEMTQSGERALEAFENTGTAADGALSKVSRTAAQTAKSTDAAADSVDDLSSAIGDYEKATGQAANSTCILSEKTTETEKNLDEAAEAARKASEEVEKFGDKSEETGKQSEESSKKSRDGIKELQGVLASAGIAATLNEIKNGFFDCSEAAAQFETSTAMVATIADTSQKSLSSISKEVRSYSNETGEAASDMAEATYQAISASVNTADAAAFAGTATKLAVGGFTSATTAVDVLTTAINSYGLAASDATQLSDYLITTQNLGKTSVDQLAQSVGKVIPLASAYNVQMDNLSSAYAVLTANGIATAESGTYLKSMLSELGDTGSDVSEVLLNSTGKTFAQLMEQGYSLGDVMSMLGDAVDGDSTAFNALWSSTEAGIGALSLFNAGADKYNSVLDSMRTSAGATEKAYSTMADTTDKSKQRMENAFNNLKISVGDVLNPALAQVYEGFTNVFAGMSDFVDEHPAVVAAISAIAVGVGGFTGALAAYNLATTAAKFVTEAFTATLAANPYVLAAAGIVAVTAAAVTLTGVLITQSDEYEGMTATCRDQYDELQRLNDQYNAACEQYGENSDAANSLRYQLDQLNDEFETNRQTVKEFVAECDGLVESHNKVMDAYNSSTSSIKDQELGTLALTQRLGELASQNTQTTASYTEMKAIIDQLNADVPGLGLTYDGVTESVDATVEAIKKAAKAQADSEYKAEQQQTYVDLLKEQSSLEQQIAEAEANLDAERQRRGMRQDDVTGDWVSGSGFWTEDSPWVAWTSDIDEYKKSLEELQSAYDENQQTLSDIEGEWRGVAQAVEDSQNQTVSYEEAVSAAVSTTQTELDNLTAAYDKAYESARTSIEGQIGLFDTMKTSSELSISDMEKAMQSQTDYLNLYSENLKKAAEYGLDDGLIKSLSDGSEESAGYINAIIQNIEKLGGSTEGMPAAASKFVTEFNSKFEETEKAKDTFADNVAKMETDFDEKMGEIETRMSKTVQNMEMTDEARKAAQDTIKAYCDAIRSMTGEAGSAAEAVANAAASHLKTAPTTTPTTTTVTGHANGTLSAQEDVYIAGEEGPELIIGARGSEVFPAQETERILAAVNSAENATNAPDDTAPEPELPEVEQPAMQELKEQEPSTATNGAELMPTEEAEPVELLPEPLAPEQAAAIELPQEQPTEAAPSEPTASPLAAREPAPTVEPEPVVQQIAEPPAPVEAQTAPEAAILPAEAAVEPVEANYPVEQEVPQESPVAAPADNRAEEPVPAPADTFPVQEAEANPAPEEPATTAPEQEPETTAAPAEPTESPEEPTATVEVPTTTPEPELPTDVPTTPFAAAALPEPTASLLPENDLPEGMEVVKEYSYLTADGQGSDAQPTGIEYVEPEVQAQTTEEAAPAEEAPVNTTAPAASDAQQEAPASSSDAPSIGETVKRIIIEINGSGSIDVGGMNEESVLDILTRHAKPVLMSIIKGEIFEEGDLAYDF
ncbi:phage tail tape measure protein [Faecalibacterium prausnitzii]|uniref:Phage tail tape measure protein n=1 Tax=Faecalibacterium prausnitzii TaxID=853 RepID=A0A3E2VAR9_9FIRM|nr:phage tail tape measure protein [Faecalibacterium prausnitzii]RGC07473.1 phage tail tape measure protein [Faecalibacterium prausnitzii]